MFSIKGKSAKQHDDSCSLSGFAFLLLIPLSMTYIQIDRCNEGRGAGN